jgi:hypothetical protein
LDKNSCDSCIAWAPTSYITQSPPPSSLILAHPRAKRRYLLNQTQIQIRKGEKIMELSFWVNAQYSMKFFGKSWIRILIFLLKLFP